MFSWLKSKLVREDWRLVHTITTSADVGTSTYKFYFHLYESNKGNRKCVPLCTVPADQMRTGIDYLINQMSVFLGQIHRWVSGRYDPNIPTYNQVPEEDLVNALRGKI